ncbi:unnamed protein product [Meloidogyne enterolobii]|uniref:Uncharacterized protein n=1 Tax=Meloidogyne enterolobii TaxID=390850 RepID=A0ACB0ZE94_MELEN
MDILIDFVSQFIQNRHEDDHFDRLNYQITPFLFVLLSLVNISKLYIGSAINCFAKAEFKEGWVQYTNDYCLVENTYYISDERIPLQKELRNRERIAYYQASLGSIYFNPSSMFFLHPPSYLEIF